MDISHTRRRRMELQGHRDQPDWLSHVNASVLKVKLAILCFLRGQQARFQFSSMTPTNR